MKFQEHICLIGFMASGKSTIAQALGKRLKMSNIDLDAYIEESVEMSISQYFESEGEKAFRKLELMTLARLLVMEQPTVISLGGGTPCQDAALKLIRPSTTVYLRVSEEDLVQRLIDSDRSTRPLIHNLDKQQIKSLVKQKMKQRRPYYSQADITVNNNSDLDTVVNRILRSLKRKQA